MPSHWLHKEIEKVVMNKNYPKVHKLLDLPSFFNGDENKELHAKLIAYFCGYYLYGEQGGFAALLHIHLDITCNHEILQNIFSVRGKPVIHL